MLTFIFGPPSRTSFSSWKKLISVWKYLLFLWFIAMPIWPTKSTKFAIFPHKLLRRLPFRSSLHLNASRSSASLTIFLPPGIWPCDLCDFRIRRFFPKFGPLRSWFLECPGFVRNSMLGFKDDSVNWHSLTTTMSTSLQLIFGCLNNFQITINSYYIVVTINILRFIQNNCNYYQAHFMVVVLGILVVERPVKGVVDLGLLVLRAFVCDNIKKSINEHSPGDIARVCSCSCPWKEVIKIESRHFNSNLVIGTREFVVLFDLSVVVRFLGHGVVVLLVILGLFDMGIFFPLTDWNSIPSSFSWMPLRSTSIFPLSESSWVPSMYFYCKLNFLYTIFPSIYSYLGRQDDITIVDFHDSILCEAIDVGRNRSAVSDGETKNKKDEKLHSE